MGTLPKKKGYLPQIIAGTAIISMLVSGYLLYSISSSKEKVTQPIAKNQQATPQKSDGTTSEKSK